jgi:hypothetical protein
MESASLADRAFHPYPAVHQLDELCANAKTQARASMRARRGSVGLAERLEDVRQKITPDPLARISHDQPDRPRRILELHRHPPARLGKLDRVRQEIPDHLPQAIPIAEDRAGGRRLWGDQIDPFCRRGNANGRQ